MNKLQSILLTILLMMGFTSEILCGSKKPAAAKRAVPVVITESAPSAADLAEEENDPEDLFGDSADDASAEGSQESQAVQEPAVEDLPRAAASAGKVAVKKAHKKAAKKAKTKGKRSIGAQLASIRKAGFTPAGHTALIKLVQDLGASVKKLRAQVGAQANRLREVEFRTGVRSKSKTTLRQQLLKKRAAKK